MLLILLIAVILATLLYPYANVAVCRLKFISQLRERLRNAGGRMRVLRTFAALSSNRADKYDILVEKNDVIYAIKLWSAAHRNVMLRIYSDGRVGEERMAVSPITPHGKPKNKSVRYMARPVPVTAENFKIPSGKTLVKVVMMYPSYKEIYAENGEGINILKSGDMFFDKVICTPYSFIRLISGEKTV